MREKYNYANSKRNSVTLDTTERNMNMTATIQKWGNSQGIRIPKYILEAIQWQDDEKVNIRTENNKIIIEKKIKTDRKNIKELFADFEGKYEPTPIDWGKPVGKEIW